MALTILDANWCLLESGPTLLVRLRAYLQRVPLRPTRISLSHNVGPAPSGLAACGATHQSAPASSSCCLLLLPSLLLPLPLLLLLLLLRSARLPASLV